MVDENVFETSTVKAFWHQIGDSDAVIDDPYREVGSLQFSKGAFGDIRRPFQRPQLFVASFPELVSRTSQSEREPSNGDGRKGGDRYPQSVKNFLSLES